MTTNTISTDGHASLPLKDKENIWNVTDCSIPGTAHVQRRHGCEDAAGWVVSGALLGIAVSDGAGSAAHSAQGSAVAVHTALKTIQAMHLTEDALNASTAKAVIRFAFQFALNALANKAEELGVEPHDLACTLIVVIADRNFVASGHVGDGAVVVTNEAGEIGTLTSPKNGEFANETTLLGCTTCVDVHISTLEEFRIKAIAAFTDGIQRLALQAPEWTPHGPFFFPLFTRLENLNEAQRLEFLQELLGSARVTTRTDDDKTLVVANPV